MQTHFIILAIVLLLNILPQRFIDRKKYILPISFLIIGVYLAIRYNYGPDYMSYMTGFYNGEEEKYDSITGEVLFFKFMHIFSKYYMFIIFHTIIFMSTLFYIVRKYINEKYYILFFFLFMCMPAMMFNMISALRSTMAACVIWWGIEFFYLRKKNIIFYCLSVVLASFFHTSVLVFLIVPIFEFIYRTLNYKLIFIILCLSLIASMFYAKDIFKYMFTNFEAFDMYSNYLYKDTTNMSNINGIIKKSLYLFPFYYILKYCKKDKGNYYFIGIFATLYMSIYCLGVDFEGRYECYLFIFVILSLSNVLDSVSINIMDKLITIVPLMINVIYNLYLMYMSMYIYRYGAYYDGNYLFYQTIFSLPQLP